MIAFFIIVLILGFIVAIPLGFTLLSLAEKSKNDNKKKAQSMIDSGRLDTDVDKVMKLLVIDKDVEADHLWKKLQEMKDAGLYQPTNICLKCGESILPGDKICYSCGVKIKR